MATVVQISGLPGTGKTFGAYTLNPDHTYIIQADKKGLPWAGWKKQYNKDKRNYAETSDANTIYKLCKGVADTRPEVSVIIIDTLNSIMSDKEMGERKRPGYDKWQDLAGEIYDLMGLLREIPREDLIVYVMAHVAPYEVDGETYWRMKTNGQKLTNLNMHSRLNYNLWTELVHNPIEGTNQYFFITQSNGKNEARSPHGVLNYKIPNDLEMVRKAILESES
jgi:hypothetical protein